MSHEAKIESIAFLWCDYGYITIITISTSTTTVEVPHIESASYLSLRRHQTPTYPCFFYIVLIQSFVLKLTQTMNLI